MVRGMTVYILSQTQIAVDIYTDTVSKIDPENPDLECTSVAVE